jgi:hypothetical protein
MRRIQPHVLLGLLHHCRTNHTPHKKGCTIRLGTRATSSTGNHHSTYHELTCPSTTRPLPPIWTRNRRIINRYWGHIISTRPTNHLSRWNNKAGTTMPMWFLLPEILHNRAKLPNLWSGIFGSYARTTLLVPSVKRNIYPCPGVYQPCKSLILPWP